MRRPPAALLVLAGTFACSAPSASAPSSEQEADESNVAPLLHLVTVSPTSPHTDDVLLASAEWTDADLDEALLTYAWSVDGTVLDATGPRLDGALHFDKGQVVGLTVTADDGQEQATLAAPDLVVQASVPSTPEIRIEPAQPLAGEALVCEVVVPATELDGDVVTHTTSWLVDGIPHAGEGVRGTDTVAGQTWICTVEASDEDGAAEPASASVAIEACAQVSAPVAVATNVNAAFTVATGDLDGDGDDDVLAGASDTIFWVENQGGGSFGAPLLITDTALGVSDIVAADFDGDGDLDVAASSRDDDTVAWHENQGGTWQEHILTTSADFARGIHTVDFDDDGDADILFAAELSSTVGWFANDGYGVFGPMRTITTSDVAPHTVATLDLDGDGDLDVVVGGYTGALGLEWYENQGNETFGPHQSVSNFVNYVVHIEAADLDGDGDDDVLAAALIDDRIVWVPNEGGVWGAPVVLTDTATTAYAVAAADIDGDGDLDVAAAARDDNAVMWFENLGAGVFAAETVVSPPSFDFPLSVAAGDLDGDGDADLVAAAERSDMVAWFENSCTGP